MPTVPIKSLTLLGNALSVIVFVQVLVVRVVVEIRHGSVHSSLVPLLVVRRCTTKLQLLVCARHGVLVHQSKTQDHDPWFVLSKKYRRPPNVN